MKHKMTRNTRTGEFVKVGKPPRRRTRVVSEAVVSSAPENPEISEAEFAKMKPAHEIAPHLIERHRRTRGPQKAPTKVQMTMRIDADILEYYKASGARWQTRINDALRKSMPANKKSRPSERTAAK